VGHRARPVKTDDFAQDLGAASRVNGETRGPVAADPTVEPGGVPSDPPAGFVRRQVGGSLDPFLDLLINGLQSLARPQHDLSTGTTGQVDAEELLERVGDLAIGHAGTLIEIDDGGLGVGTELALGGAGGV